MLLHSIRGIKLEPSFNGRTKLCSLFLVLCSVFLSSGRNLITTWWGFLQMARENLVSALIARWVMSMFSRSRKFMRFSLLTISSVFTFGITPPCQCGVHHFCHGCSFVGFMECRACKSCSGFGTDYTSSKPPKTPCYVMLSPSLLSVPRAFFLVSN